MSGDGRVPTAGDAAAASAAKPRWRRAVESAARILLGCVVLLFIMVRVLEGRFLYHPTTFPDGDWGAPERAGVECEDVSIDAPDGVRLHGWFLRAVEPGNAGGGGAGQNDDANAARVTILFLHGNAGNVSHRWSWLRGLSRLPADVLAIDYRGYGRSEGSPSEEGIYLDAEAAYRHLTESRGVAPERIVVYGRSLGGAPACEVASRFECGGLVLQSTFTSAPDMSGRVVPLVPLGWAMGTSFDCESMIARVKAPVLIIHSRADRVVPYWMGERLFATASEPKDFVSLDRSLHNDLAADEEARVFAKLGEFCGGVARAPK
ncbi:MAG: alpha/beta hydrolase [Planctomycetota bacterium]|jgi:fermentation-respiration switch protein FrsA (DUF1100 family)